MTIIARTCKELAEALNSQGFFLVADLPARTRIEIRRGMIVVRMP
ncbi:hypothetical protein Q1W70_00440 [Pseudomonas kielensis]|nr:hypothetical protein [Pseudomonas kielensis]WKL53108.1 hypothetical protein Q1W70_00440 [Pseudomonas kielensis]